MFYLFHALYVLYQSLCRAVTSVARYFNLAPPSSHQQNEGPWLPIAVARSASVRGVMTPPHSVSDPTSIEQKKARLMRPPSMGSRIPRNELERNQQTKARERRKSHSLFPPTSDEKDALVEGKGFVDRTAKHIYSPTEGASSHSQKEVAAIPPDQRHRPRAISPLAESPLVATGDETLVEVAPSEQEPCSTDATSVEMDPAPEEPKLPASWPLPRLPKPPPRHALLNPNADRIPSIIASSASGAVELVNAPSSTSLNDPFSLNGIAASTDAELSALALRRGVKPTPLAMPKRKLSLASLSGMLSPHALTSESARERSATPGPSPLGRTSPTSSYFNASTPTIPPSGRRTPGMDVESILQDAYDVADPFGIASESYYAGEETLCASAEADGMCMLGSLDARSASPTPPDNSLLSDFDVYAGIEVGMRSPRQKRGSDSSLSSSLAHVNSTKSSIPDPSLKSTSQPMLRLRTNVYDLSVCDVTASSLGTRTTGGKDSERSRQRRQMHQPPADQCSTTIESSTSPASWSASGSATPELTDADSPAISDGGVPRTPNDDAEPEMGAADADESVCLVIKEVEKGTGASSTSGSPVLKPLILPLRVARRGQDKDVAPGLGLDMSLGPVLEHAQMGLGMGLEVDRTVAQDTRAMDDLVKLLDLAFVVARGKRSCRVFDDGDVPGCGESEEGEERRVAYAV